MLFSTPLFVFHFFTFHGTSYLVDVYRKIVSAQKNFVDLALYIGFFPQLIAGPIIRYHDLHLVLFQDSFGRALAPFFAESFGTSMFIWDYPDFATMALTLKELKPDIVIEQRVERHLKSMPPHWAPLEIE